MLFNKHQLRVRNYILSTTRIIQMETMYCHFMCWIYAPHELQIYIDVLILQIRTNIPVIKL